MSDTDGATPASSTAAPVSRRAALLELAGMAIVLAVPVGAVLATANPIPNPPSRKTLNFPQIEGTEEEQQQRQEVKKAKRRKNQRTDEKQEK